MHSKCNNFLGFVKMLTVLNFSTKILSSLTIVSLIACYVSKELTSATFGHLSHVLSDKSGSSHFFSFIVTAFAECCCITILYWLLPAHGCAIIQFVESMLVRDCLRMNFESFYDTGPAKHASRIYRNSSSIKDCAEILTFDLLGNVINIFSSLRIISRMVESTIFMYLVIVFTIIAIIQMLLVMSLNYLKKQCIKIDDARAEEMSGFYDNFILAKITNTDEHTRMDPFFKSGVYLKYTILMNFIKLQSSIYFVMVNVVVLSFSSDVRNNIFCYLKEFCLLILALESLIAKGFQLESKRMEIEDMEQKDENSSKMSTEASDHSPYVRPLPVQAFSSLSLKHISIFIHGILILHDINLIVNKGDRIALVGNNGTGKSIFFKFLLGFLQYTGDVSVNNENPLILPVDH